jgi:hypothetical protein
MGRIQAVSRRIATARDAIDEWPVILTVGDRLAGTPVGDRHDMRVGRGRRRDGEHERARPDQ